MILGKFRYPLFALWWGLIVAGCGGKSEAICAWDEGAQADLCALADAHNFELDTVLAGESTALASGQEATFSWEDATTDLLGRPLTSCEALQSASIWLFPALTSEELLSGLAQEQLPPGSLGAIWNCVPESCACDFADFVFVGHAFESAVDFVPDRGTWSLLLSGGEIPGVRMLALFEPDVTETNTALSVPDAGVTGEALADWADAEALVIDTEEPVLDWSDLTVDGWGNSLGDSALDRLQIDRLDVHVSDLETQLGALDTLSLERWEASLGGATRLALSELEGGFPGVDLESTWLLTLWCSTCRLAVPRVAVLLEPGE